MTESLDLDKLDQDRVREGRNLADLDSFWHSFSYISTHESTLKDTEVIKSFRNAFKNNKHLVEGKVVLDVGCGLGVLCMFAAQHGAAHVYGIEKADIVDKTREIVRANGFEDKITIIEGLVEEVELPEGVKADIIVSEWMGYILFYGGQLPCYLYARDKWLKEGGLMFPDEGSLYVCGVYDKETFDTKFDWWKNAWEWDMSVISDKSRNEVFLNYNDVNYPVTDECKMLAVELHTVKAEELEEWEAPFVLTCTNAAYVYALMVYFEVEFTECHKRITLKTGPTDKPTRFRQSMFYLQEPMYLEVGDKMTGKFHCTKNKVNPRDLDFVVSYTVNNQFYKSERVQKFYLS